MPHSATVSDGELPSDESYCLFETAIGTCGIAWRDAGLTRLQLPEATPAATARRVSRGGLREAEPPAWVAEAIAALRSYFEGRPVPLEAIPVDLGGIGDFERDIYRATRALGRGETASYGEVARRAGHPGAARGVGQAMARNPVPVVIPCHRVLAAGRRLGGFSAPGGGDTKMRLLGLEGVVPEGVAPRLPGL
jgi:methylated-DNA-[protein]-cysteine S-methyltransferase